MDDIASDSPGCFQRLAPGFTMTERAKANRMLLGFFAVFSRDVFFFGNSCKVIVYKMISGYIHVPVNFHCANSDLVNFIFAPVR